MAWKMRNPLRDILTDNEQKVLLGFCLLCGVGMALMLFGWSPVHASQKVSSPDSLFAAVRTDFVHKIDIRIADKDELMKLSGIGAKRADDIIDFRNRKQFDSVYELLEIKGIGEKTLNSMLPNLLLFGADTTVVNHTDHATSAKDKPSTTKVVVDKNAMVNLNTASLDELMSLEGVGKVKANAILEYRNSNGAFQSIDDFTKVKGIGEKTLEKNRHRLRI